MIAPISLVIPILNESASLPDLLAAVKAQTLPPAEIIFVDAGSQDGSRELIENWWKKEKWEGTSCRVLLKAGALPGAGRNAGIHATDSDWIAFLDGGITPENDWLENLFNHAGKNGVEAVFGLCHFSAASAFAKSVCALSYGHGTLHPVIPASLFKRRIFEEVGYFPENLRAAEDIVWVNNLISHFGKKEICAQALVRYTHFPSTWTQAIRKWRITEYNSVLAGARTAQQLTYLLTFPLVCFAFLESTAIGITIVSVYIFFRGIIDPARRSKDKPWWGTRPLALIIAPVLVSALDLAKLAGIVQGGIARLCNAASLKLGRA